MPTPNGVPQCPCAQQRKHAELGRAQPYISGVHSGDGTAHLELGQRRLPKNEHRPGHDRQAGGRPDRSAPASARQYPVPIDTNDTTKSASGTTYVPPSSLSPRWQQPAAESPVLSAEPLLKMSAQKQRL